MHAGAKPPVMQGSTKQVAQALKSCATEKHVNIGFMVDFSFVIADVSNRIQYFYCLSPSL
jgi:hypothetical protein